MALFNTIDIAEGQLDRTPSASQWPDSLSKCSVLGHPVPDIAHDYALDLPEEVSGVSEWPPSWIILTLGMKEFFPGHPRKEHVPEELLELFTGCRQRCRAKVFDGRTCNSRS